MCDTWRREGRPRIFSWVIHERHMGDTWLVLRHNSEGSLLSTSPPSSLCIAHLLFSLSLPERGSSPIAISLPAEITCRRKLAYRALVALPGRPRTRRAPSSGTVPRSAWAAACRISSLKLKIPRFEISRVEIIQVEFDRFEFPRVWKFSR